MLVCRTRHFDFETWQRTSSVRAPPQIPPCQRRMPVTRQLVLSSVDYDLREREEMLKGFTEPVGIAQINR